MPSTYSPTLRIELIGAGEQDGTWGTTTNSNLGSIIEQAITGVQTITFVDANYTLTAFNGLPDESRNAVLVLAGTNTTTRQLIAPAVEKVYVVSNGTGAGVTIKTSAGTGVTVPNGATQIVYCNGTNFELAASQTNVIAGTGISVSTTGINSTVSVNPAVTATLTDAQTLTNKTLVSPAITGTPTAPTATVTTDNTQIATTAFVRDIIPAGIISMWSGAIGAIPTGWLLCDGSNGTPDLRDRFVMGAGSSYAVGATGGATTATLSAGNIPSHTHSLSASGTTSTESANHSHTFSGTTSNAGTHSHIYQTGYQTNVTIINQNGNFGGGTPDDGSYRYESETAGDHNHTYSGTTSGISQNHTHTVTVSGTSGATGSGSAFNIQNPYYALAYIMKS